MLWKIREMRETEHPLLEDFLYEAIYVPEGIKPPLRSVIHEKELALYISDFGKQEHDRALAAETGGRIAGAVWGRIMDDYGHLDDSTPSLAISLYREYRGLGIGMELMAAMLACLKENGYRQTSLSVQKANYAVKMYRKLGFETVRENAEEYIMRKIL